MRRKDLSRVAIINRVTVIGLIVNLVLTISKIAAGIIGKSSAMVADGVHSVSDLATDIVVIVFVRISGKDRDKNHQYGHGKYETFATMLISFAMTLVGIGILYNGSMEVWAVINGHVLESPGIIAVYAALASIFAKETIFWYTRIQGRKVGSQALEANAWHHRSDALSSIGTALGISGAIFLGEQWRVLDPIAGIVVSIFILRASWKIGLPSINELLESSLSKDVEKRIKRLITETPGVENFHNFKSRKIGDNIAVDVHVRVDRNLSVEQSHDIATLIEKSIRNEYGKNSHVGIHIEPFYSV